MAITLRKNKGSALSYEELDINFHEYFYSASVSSDSKQLTLHYTQEVVYKVLVALM